MGKTTKLSANITLTPLEIEGIHKNLGENGAGQRKNITSDKPKTLTNQTVDKTVLQNITLSKNQTEDEDLAIDSFPPDANKLNKTLEEHHITNSTEVSKNFYAVRVYNSCLSRIIICTTTVLL